MGTGVCFHAKIWQQMVVHQYVKISVWVQAASFFWQSNMQHMRTLIRKYLNSKAAGRVALFLQPKYRGRGRLSRSVHLATITQATTQVEGFCHCTQRSSEKDPATDPNWSRLRWPRHKTCMKEQLKGEARYWGWGSEATEASVLCDYLPLWTQMYSCGLWFLSAWKGAGCSSEQVATSRKLR